LSQQRHILVFLGPPGSGKGTQAKFLADRLKIPQIALGDILRDEVRKQTAVGQRAKEFMDAGRLVPDELTIELARKRIEQDDCQAGFIFDGFPRSQIQAEALDKMMAEKKLTLDKVVYFSIPEEEVVKRLSGRRSCKDCGAVYHLVSKAPRMAMKCDHCGGELYLRSDDKEEVIRSRFEVYEKQTKPLIDYYRQTGKLVELDAAQPMAEVTKELIRLTA